MSHEEWSKALERYAELHGCEAEAVPDEVRLTLWTIFSACSGPTREFKAQRKREAAL